MLVLTTYVLFGGVRRMEWAAADICFPGSAWVRSAGLFSPHCCFGHIVGCTYSFSKQPPSWCDQLEYILWRIRFTDLV